MHDCSVGAHSARDHRIAGAQQFWTAATDRPKPSLYYWRLPLLFYGRDTRECDWEPFVMLLTSPEFDPLTIIITTTTTRTTRWWWRREAVRRRKNQNIVAREDEREHPSVVLSDSVPCLYIGVGNDDDGDVDATIAQSQLAVTWFLIGGEWLCERVGIPVAFTACIPYMYSREYVQGKLGWVFCMLLSMSHGHRNTREVANFVRGRRLSIERIELKTAKRFFFFVWRCHSVLNITAELWKPVTGLWFFNETRPIILWDS